VNIHSIYRTIGPIFRNRRFRWFRERIQPQASETILDVGGFADTWVPHEPCANRIDILNIHEVPCSDAVTASHGIHTLIGDGTALEMADASYDVVFSNSVIEHVGDYAAQQRFAAELRRVGKRIWVQTPARSFFIEPHYIAPFIHWFPKSVQKKLIRNFTVRGWMTRPSPETVQGMIDEIRLISKKEFQELFPDCEILNERFLGIFVKSYVAFRV